MDSGVIELDSDSVASSPTVPKRRINTDHYTDPSNTPSRRRMNPPHNTGSVNGFVKAEETATNLNWFSPRGPQAPITPGSSVQKNGSGSTTLPRIREILNSKRRPGMPNAIPHQVYVDLCKDAVKPWDGPLKHFLTTMVQLLHKEINHALDASFSTLKKRLVYRESKRFLAEFVKGHRETLDGRLKHALKMEKHGLYTVNTAFFNHNLDEERRILARHRHHYRWAAYCGQPAERIKPLEQLSDEERQQEMVKTQKEAAKMGQDKYEQELGVIAYVRAYYLTAAARFIDNVSLHVIAGLFPDVSESVKLYLDERLGLFGITGTLRVSATLICPRFFRLTLTPSFSLLQTEPSSIASWKKSQRRQI